MFTFSLITWAPTSLPPELWLLQVEDIICLAAGPHYENQIQAGCSAQSCRDLPPKIKAVRLLFRLTSSLISFSDCVHLHLLLVVRPAVGVLPAAADQKKGGTVLDSMRASGSVAV